MNNNSGAPSIQFLGAAGTVTGSRFLLTCQGVKVTRSEIAATVTHDLLEDTKVAFPFSVF